MAQPAVTTYTVSSGLPINGGRWPGGRLGGGVDLAAASAGGGFDAPSGALAGGVVLGDASAAGEMTHAMAAQQLAADGIWTWFTDPRAVEHVVDGARVTDIGYITAAGSPAVTRVPHDNVAGRTSFTLRTAMQVDDHNNPAMLVRPDGTLMSAYCRHPDATADQHRIRISSAANSIAAWGAEANPAATDPSYANLARLSVPGRTYLNFRSGSSGTYPQKCLVSTDDGASWAAEETWFSYTNHRPYPKWATNGTNRIDVLTTEGHPSSMATSIYHFYVVVAADGTKTFYSSDGVSLGAGPIDPTSATRIYDGASGSGRSWTWDITYGSDGHPHVLFAKFVGTTDHRLMYARWTGSAWTTPVQVVAMGSRLYAGEVYYSAGACFDGNTPDRVFAAVESGGASDLAEYRSSDSGETWAKHRDITTGGGTWNIRPWSPRGHNGRIAVLWCRGGYTSFTSYATEIWGAG